MVQRNRISQKGQLLLVLASLSGTPSVQSFTTSTTRCRSTRASNFLTVSALQASSNDDGDTSPDEAPKKTNRQSVLYYDKTAQYTLERKQKKEKELENQKIALYHNKLEKNANDCSVCTVPDKIDSSRIAAPQKEQANGVTQALTTADKLMQIKKDVNQLIQEPSVELSDTLLILFSSFLLALGTVPMLPPNLVYAIYFCQDATLYLFAFGFLSRWLSSLEPRGSYFKDSLEWVDLTVVMLPFLFLTVPGVAAFFPPWVTSQTFLVNLRLLRLLRFQRILQDEFTFSKFMSGLWIPGQENNSCMIIEVWQLQLARVLLSLFTLLSVSTGLIYSAEHTVNPGISDYFSALYFGLTTLTTVGFGDVTPITWQGKLVVSGSILAGVAVIPAQAAALVEALLSANGQERAISNDNPPIASRAPPPPAPTSMGKNLVLETTQTCPYCKAGLHWTQANFCYNCGETISL